MADDLAAPGKVETSPASNPKKNSRVATAAFLVALLALGMTVLGPLLAHFRILAPLQGFGLLALAMFFGGLLAIVLGIPGMVRTRGGRRLGGRRAATGFSLGVALLAIGVLLALPGSKVPAIHDITTSPDRAPEFLALAQLPENIDRDLTYPSGGDVNGRTVTELQREAYPDLAPIALGLPPAQALERSVAVARELGWQIEKDDPANLRFEAFDETFIFRFVDDVVVEVEPRGSGSLLHVRSTSRIGQSDLGKNAARIRAFAKALEEDTVPLDSLAAAGPKLYVFDCGKITVADPSAFSLTAEEAGTDELFVPCYLIEHEKGRLLWDAGLPASVAQAGGRVEESDMVMTLERTLDQQLAELDLEPSDIDLVAFSHLHFDHCGHANLFTDSTLLIQRAEYEAAFGADPIAVFDPTLYSDLADNQTVLLAGDHDVFGDDSVRILSTPGHTPGHQSLLVRLASGPIVLSGDLYHFRASRELERVPVFNTDAEASRDSMRRIESLLEEEKATLWIEHDAALAATLAKAPAFHQ
jgi:glyoxylase-like metal-dependent hydrolase (beta-lactamase superfamily II)/uncharacterized protein (DUF1499 family)